MFRPRGFDWSHFRYASINRVDRFHKTGLPDFVKQGCQICKYRHNFHNKHDFGVYEYVFGHKESISSNYEAL